MTQPQRQFTVSCRDCDFAEPYEKPRVRCPQCGGKWFDAHYDYEAVARAWPGVFDDRDFNMWRYRDLLPVRADENIVTLGEGMTPLIRAHNLGQMLGHPHIYIKDERQGPTGSFKDRQAAVAISAMKEADVREAVVASAGNVAIAYSAFGARAGIKSWVFVASSVPAEKMREVALYGSEVVKIAGTYDQTKQIAADFAESKGLFLDQGIKGIAAKEAMKTLAFEIAEQLGNQAAGRETNAPNGSRAPWRAPDWYLQAISGGLGPVGVMKGFAELQQMGFVEQIPKLACFQVAGCAPIVNSFKQGLDEPEAVEQPATQIATLSTGKPGDAYHALRDLIAAHGGTMETVTDAEAFQALQTVAEMDGFSFEPAAAVTFAGLFKLIKQGVIKKDELVVVNGSGHTFPVEKHIVGDSFTRDVVVDERGVPRQEGLLTALEELDPRVRRIAILEDNPDATRLIRRILQAQGDYLIDEADDGAAGLRMMQETPPNLLILDLMMPGLDGFSVVEAMKADPRLANIPIIVVTAKELSAIEYRRLRGKIKSLWQKGSFMVTDLLQEIEEALPENDE